MTKNFRTAYVLALLAIVCLFTSATAQAQSVYGSIFGSVTDKTGAVVAGATVTATDESKGTVVTVVTNGAGDYTVSHLVPDTYDLKIEVKGFKGFVSKGIIVQADTAPRVDVSLEIAGASAETITVNADTEPQLKTDRADVSTVFDQQQVADLPIGDQNFTNLQLLLPGAQQLGGPTLPVKTHRLPSRFRSMVRPSVEPRLNLTARITKIRFLESSSSTQRWMQSLKLRSLRKTSMRSLARQFPQL